MIRSNKYGYIYLIENLINNKQYIGAKFGDPSQLNNYYSSGKLVLEDIEKYGIENFKKFILVENISTDDDLLDHMEAYFIKEFKTHISNRGYNIDRHGGTIRVKTDKTKQKISESLMGQKKSEEHKKNISCARIGIILSVTHRKNIALAGKGNTHATKGDVFVDPDDNIYKPTYASNFCKDHKISGILLGTYQNEFITDSHFKGYGKLALNTVGWARFTRDFVLNTGFL